MKYLFDMGEVWHVYADVGNQWIYYRMEQVNEEAIDKNGADLPGPLGRLDMQKTLEEAKMQMQQEKERIESQKKDEVEYLKQQFESSYAELKELAEKMQEEGRIWRQRYLDLAYQVSPKGK